MYFKYKNINLYYEEYISNINNKNLIILPGFGDTRKTFNNLIYHLSDKYNIYIVDFPGFGNTKFPSYDLTIYDYSLMIHEWIKSLNINNITLIGHSFGGRIIITLCGYYKYKYDDIILIDSAGIKPKKSLFYKIKLSIYKFLQKIIKNKKLKTKLHNLFSSNDYKSIPNNMKKTFQNVVNEDLKDYLKYIDARCLIIWGELDNITTLKDAYKLNKLIKNSELIVIKNTNHYAYLGREKLISSIFDNQLL